MGELILVTGHDADAVEAAAPPTSRSCGTPRIADGQSTSLAAALHAVADDSEGAVILMADQPGIDAADVRALIARFHSARGQSCASGMSMAPDRRCSSREIYAEAGHLHGDAGARVLMASHPEWVDEVRIDRRAARRDTPEDLPR